MKRNIFLAATLIIFTSKLFAQSEKKNIIKTNLTSPIFSTFHLNYERAFSNKISGQLGFMYTGLKNDNTKINGFAITPEVRLYPKQNALEGFFLGLSPRYQSFTLKADNDEATLSSFGAALIVGGQWIFGDIVSLELYGGPSFNSSTLKIESGSEDDFNTSGVGDGVGFRFGVAVGFAF